MTSANAQQAGKQLRLLMLISWAFFNLWSHLRY